MRKGGEKGRGQEKDSRKGKTSGVKIVNKIEEIFSKYRIIVDNPRKLRGKRARSEGKTGKDARTNEKAVQSAPETQEHQKLWEIKYLIKMNHRKEPRKGAGRR